MPNKGKKGKTHKTRDILIVWGVNVKCYRDLINLIYRDIIDTHQYFSIYVLKNVDDISSRLSPLLSDRTPSWLTLGSLINKLNINLEA